MPMLGDILAVARDGAGTFQPWLKKVNPHLAAAVDEAAHAEALTPTSYVRAAISDFARFASEEDWATLTSTLKRTDDPGTACLMAMVDWRLAARVCPTHANHNHEEGTTDDRSN